MMVSRYIKLQTTKTNTGGYGNPTTKRNYLLGINGSEHICKIPLIIWIPLVTCIIFLFVLDIFQITSYNYYRLPRLRSEELHEDPKLSEAFIIYNEGCKIPIMKPFDKSVIEYIKKPEKPNCNEGKPPLFEANETSLFILNSSLPAYNVQNVTTLSCCYKSFWRVPPVKPSEKDDNIEYSKNCIPVEDSVTVSKEFIMVKCSYSNKIIYKDYFSFVPLTRSKASIEAMQTIEEPFNILIIGLDSISRINLHRQMPKTVNYLKNLTAIELLGYNKVADDTFSNVIPILTGLSVSQLSHSCWRNNKRFDQCYFLWETYKQKGYVTSFSEDAAWMGVFNFRKKGFKKQPTDYMWGYFNGEAEKKIGNQHKFSLVRCVGSRQVYETSLDYINKFTNVMHRAKRKYFAFFWSSSLSHDYLNVPNLGDNNSKELLENLKSSGRLDNTILFFLSDHGMRWGLIRRTYQGRMEERLPFLFAVLPEKFKIQYPISYENMVKNARRLTTPFDFHETLKDLSQFHETSPEISVEKRRGYSLFRAISPKRTCDDADISRHWCTCQQSKKLSKTDNVVNKVSKHVVHFINSLLEGYTQCSSLSLKDIMDAYLMTHGEDILKGKLSFEDYLLTIQTEPGDGVFESTVRHYLKDSKHHFEILGAVNRLNSYGEQSLCATDFHLKLYCYCKNLLTSTFQANEDIT